MFKNAGRVRIELLQGDLAAQRVDALVNAANSALAGGGGVDGALHRAAGPTLMAETDRLYPRGCPTGSAVATAAGNLPVRYVFHAVGPVWRGGDAGEEDLLRSAVAKCLELAREHQCPSIAFPAISTGVYNYPLDHAARAMLTTIIDNAARFESEQVVRIVLFDQNAYREFAKVLGEMGGEES